MKTNILVFVAAALFTLVLFAPSAANAGDDAVTQLTLSADAGANNECTGALRYATHYAVQPTVNAYVRVSTPLLSDGGTRDPATSANVRVDANKLYDVWTTGTQNRICCKPVAAGAASACNIFQFKSIREP